MQKGERMSATIECVGLTKYYGKHRGIERLTFEVPQGATFGFLGPNGAGKTTTIRCLLGMLKATGGEARVFGERVNLDGAQLRKRIGYVPGEVNLYEKQTGAWHIDYIARFRGGHAPLAKELVERLDFEPHRKVKELSKGNKQKLALILGMMHDPELLVLDEPTSGLDPLNQEIVFDIVTERVAAGATLFLSSHILSEVERVCDRVGIIREGTLVAEERVETLLHRHLRRLQVSFGDPAEASMLAGIPGVEGIEVLDEHTMAATVKGENLDALVKQLARYCVTDLEIEHASLEEVFVEYYKDGGHGAGGPDPVGTRGGEAS